MTPEKEQTEENPQKQDLDPKQVEAIIKENQSYRTLLAMGNKNYYRAELVETMMLIQNQLVQLTSTIDTRLEDLNKIILSSTKK